MKFDFKMSFKKVILFTLFAVNLIDQPTPVVEIEQGLLTGKISLDGNVFEYTGIPYATTKGRFQAPLPAPSWQGVYKAVLNHYHCPQKIEIGYIGTEDCLRVNVYVPTEAKKPLPVMVYIHGGAFMFGSGGRMMAGPELLLKHDVILVTLNYRLGALGFLCLGIEEAPGNAGLKDQIAALKWVKKNIAAFGGDPDNITLFGHSAGAVSTSILLASDAAHGLFHRAIAQSGAAVGFMTNIDAVKIASSVAKYFGYDTENPKDLFKVLSEVPIKDLVTYTSVAFEPIIKSVRSNLMFGPCVEKIIPGIEPVYVELPSDIISKNPGNVPVIYGFTNREGYYLTILETDESLKKYNESLFDFPDFEFPTKTEAESTLKKLKKLYFGDKDVSRETRNNLDDLYGDYYFKAPTILESELKVSIGNASIYNYHFTYAGWRNLVKGFYGRDLSGPGASHGDDILYTFTSFIWPFPIFKRDQRIINWMTKLWTNFAKYGDPTPSSDKDLPIKWKPSTKEALNFLTIDETLEFESIPNPEKYEFWKDLYRRYRKNKR